MPFVKLDCGILNSSLWIDTDARTVFITALLMARPHELLQTEQALDVSTMQETGLVIPPGWYGLIEAAGPGIVRQAGLDKDAGMRALARLCSEDPESRSQDWGGRRLVRINGGYLALNYDKYRERDYNAAERMKRYRERNRVTASHRNGVTRKQALLRNVTQAEAEAEADTEKKQPKARTAAPEIPDSLKFASAEISAFISHRIEIKKPIKQTGMSMLFSRLNAAIAKGIDVRACLRESVSNGWQGVFLDRNPIKSGPESADEAAERLAKELRNARGEE